MTIMKSLLLVCLCWFPLEICPLARRGNVGEGRDSRRERRGRGAERRIGKWRPGGQTDPRSDEGVAEQRGEGPGRRRKEGREKNNGEQEREVCKEEQNGGGGRRGGRGNGEPEGQTVARAESAAAGGARGRGLISFTNGCEMRLAPLEAVRV